jgi:para-aminobenzoate synthetase component 1
VEGEGTDPSPSLLSEVRCSFTREAYLDAVRTVKDHIRAGDIYQANLSQRFDVPTGLHPVDLYDRLRAASPAPFACHIDCGGFSVIGASPERFLRVRGRHVETRPIKGTRRRGRTPGEDGILGRELISSEKDGAELAMIVDVERNDLGRVAQYGSVRVVRRKALRTHPTVLHLEATVEGRLRDGMGPVDCIRAAFPGGSITGAPKIRAMEILEGIEPTRRGVYTGAVGYFGFDGRCDLNIAIRTLVLKQGVAIFQAGGGIVADSDPLAEYEESLDKARALMRALGIDGDRLGRVMACPSSTSTGRT